MWIARCRAAGSRPANTRPSARRTRQASRGSRTLPPPTARGKGPGLASPPVTSPRGGSLPPNRHGGSCDRRRCTAFQPALPCPAPVLTAGRNQLLLVRRNEPRVASSVLPETSSRSQIAPRGWLGPCSGPVSERAYARTPARPAPVLRLAGCVASAATDSCGTGGHSPGTSHGGIPSARTIPVAHSTVRIFCRCGPRLRLGPIAETPSARRSRVSSIPTFRDSWVSDVWLRVHHCSASSRTIRFGTDSPRSIASSCRGA